MEIGICKLCGNQSELQMSHIIPKFVAKWVKKTSVTGFLRMAAEINKRQQDYPKVPLLCSKCEGIFLSYEKKFAEHIFLPFQNGSTSFDYDKWLQKFIVSLNWRLGILEYIDPKNHLTGVQRKELRKALRLWGDFLLDIRTNTGAYKHHIFFLDTVQSVNVDELKRMSPNWYFLRATDGTVAYSKKEIFLFSKFLGIIFVSTVYPREMNGFDGTLVSKHGKLLIPQHIRNHEIGTFINSRIKTTYHMASKLSETQEKLIARSYETNKEKVKTAQSMKAFEADQKLRGK